MPSWVLVHRQFYRCRTWRSGKGKEKRGLGALFNPVLTQQSGPGWEDVLGWSTDGFQEGGTAANKSSNPKGKALHAVRTDRFSLQPGLRVTEGPVLSPILYPRHCPNKFIQRMLRHGHSDSLRLTSILYAPGAWCSDPTMFEALFWGFLDMFHLVLMEELMHPIKTVILEETAQRN